jgi:hypothetical protein
MARPNTKDWKALENAHQPSGLHVIVTGLAELSPGEKPVLTERAGQAEGLELELTTADSNESNFDAKVWKAAQFHKEVEENQYNSVRVMSGSAVVAEFPVLDDSEHAQLMAKRTTAQNSAAGARKAPSPAKKVVKKAVDAVKEVVGKVAEAVTGGAKKRSKKVKKAKKTAKKTKAVGGWAKKRTKKAAKKAPKAKKKKSAKKTKQAKAKKRRR